MSSAGLLQVCSPKDWPDPPTWISYSTATQVEACPRQWGLKRGDYPEVWDGFGYPPWTSFSILKGRVIHRSVETILDALCRRDSFTSPEAVLERLGGYTTVVEEEIQGVIEERVVGNPRVQDQVAGLESDLKSAVDELRTKVQRHIAQLDEVPMSGKKTLQDSQRRRAYENRPRERNPLPPGIYAEQWVQAPSIGWGGYIDLLYLSDDRCEISDIKTGKAKESHVDQVRLYALFWWLDNELNPDSRVADTLRLRYPSETIELSAPDETQLKKLRHQVKERGEEIRALIDESPPPARPEKERCGRCDVKHLCEAYWSDETQSRLAGDSAPDFADVELRLTNSYAPNMWYAQVLCNGHWQRGKELIFEARKGPSRFQNLDEIRILGGQVTNHRSRDRTVLRETRYSEAFLLKRL